MKKNACPTADRLTAFILGRLTEDELRRVAEHSLDCPDCQARMHDADTFADDLIKQIRQAPLRDGIDSEPILSKLLPRIEALNSGSDSSSLDTPSQANEDSMNASGELKRLLAPPQAPDEIGRLGSYRVLKVIGAGGMGIVLQAEDPSLHRLAALKVMNPSMACHPTARQRFLLEARATAQVRNDHVVTIYQVGEENGTPFLAMEFLEGETLESQLKRTGGSNGGARLPVEDILRIGQEVAQGLSAAHERGLVHRDIKPANIWLEKGAGRVKIVDFGLARTLYEDNQLTAAGNVLGTPAFMSPEQANGKTVDARSDLFSLGGVLYLLCTGQNPFRGETTFDTLMAVVNEPQKPIGELNARMPEALIDLVDRLLAKKPDDRPDTAQAVVEVMQQMRRQAASASPPDPTVALPIKQAPPRSVPRPRSRFPFVAALLLIAGTTGGIGYFMVTQQGESPNTHASELARSAAPTASGILPTSKKHLPDEEFNKRVAKLRGVQQIKAVSDQLKLLNPGFPGIGPNKEGFQFTKQHADGSFGIWKVMIPSDTLADVSPLAALPEMGQLVLAGSKPGLSKLSDLSPLRDLKLTVLDISNTEVEDLSPLQGMAATLTQLNCRNTHLKNLTGLKPLTELHDLDCDSPTRQADVVLLRLLPTLRRINGLPRGEYLTGLKTAASGE